MKTIAIIPARYASTRFPGKPLADLGGKPVVEWVYRGVSEIELVDEVCVATDDERIAAAVKQFGGNCVMTRTDHKSGTERCGEVVEKMKSEGKMFDIVLNVQGDEPFVNKEQITTLLAAFNDNKTEIATLAKRITSTEELTSPNNVKVITDEYNIALYFSRTPIPYVRDCSIEQWVDKHYYLKHIGIYAYLSNVLKNLVELETTPLEESEKLEQLRWLEHGYVIKVIETECENIGIDTLEDLEAARLRLKA
ncbi:MAG: 3-deoxy-manno-octulosonate cytidylyltransferase [Bacteroidales bacterium]|nr:3-deoxy-manno-octulosonate cytidylyltransferase [Bacteroidales bacterium]